MHCPRSTNEMEGAFGVDESEAAQSRQTTVIKQVRRVAQRAVGLHREVFCNEYLDKMRKLNDVREMRDAEAFEDCLSDLERHAAITAKLDGNLEQGGYQSEEAFRDVYALAVDNLRWLYLKGLGHEPEVIGRLSLIRGEGRKPPEQVQRR